MTAITRDLAGFVAGLSYDALPVEVRERVKALALDLVGISLRARNEAESTPAMVAAAGRLGMTGGTCTVIGDAAGYAPPGAAMLNGTLAHSLDFDDTHASGSLHSSAPIVPAAFAAAEMTGADGKAVIAAIVAGYELQIRLSLALDPAAHYDRGFHPTATCGAFGAAAAAGRLLGLDPEGHANAFGIALSMAAGSMQFLVNGAWTKRSHVGHAAMCGLIAATLAREGYKGASDAIEGKWGFLHAYAPAADAAKAVDGLGRRWETLKIAVKPYPSCRYSHAPIDGILALAAAARHQGGGGGRGRGRPARAGLENHRRPGAGQAVAEVGRGWPVFDGVLRRCRAAQRRPRVGRLRAPSRRPRDAGAVQAGTDTGRSQGSGRFPGGDERERADQDRARRVRDLRPRAERRAGELPLGGRAARQVRRACRAVPFGDAGATSSRARCSRSSRRRTSARYCA